MELNSSSVISPRESKSFISSRTLKKKKKKKKEEEEEEERRYDSSFEGRSFKITQIRLTIPTKDRLNGKNKGGETGVNSRQTGCPVLARIDQEQRIYSKSSTGENSV